jgi:hypothetical protein
MEDRLDRSIRKYKRSNPEFYGKVMSAREIIDRHGPGRGMIKLG